MNNGYKGERKRERDDDDDDDGETQKQSRNRMWLNPNGLLVSEPP